jgi:hypothetical protein
VPESSSGGSVIGRWLKVLLQRSMQTMQLSELAGVYGASLQSLRTDEPAI